MLSYVCLNGQRLDLATLSTDELAYLQMVAARFEAGASADEVYELAISHSNPVLSPTRGWVTRTVMDHPLYQALEDLQARADVREGAPVEAADDPTRPLFVDAAAGPLASAALKLPR